LSIELGWFPFWAVCILLPWMALHLYYDISINADLRKQRKPGERPSRGLFGLRGYKEIMHENTRRFERGDPLARLVTYYDWVVMAGVLLLVGHRVFFR
jgi:hypothetical protein